MAHAESNGELLERVPSIRASERRICQQTTGIFAERSIDYEKNLSIMQDFYAMVIKQVLLCFHGEEHSRNRLSQC
ncbi:MAG: RhuM family protein [[Clostridium] leptum]